VHSREKSNVARLLDALVELEAIYLAQPELLMTKFGPLDIPGTIGAARDYAALLPSCVTVSIGEELQILILDLAVLIEVKTEPGAPEVGAPKDAAVLPVLRRTLEERSR
jgi:hypothetical protein